MTKTEKFLKPFRVRPSLINANAMQAQLTEALAKAYKEKTELRKNNDRAQHKVAELRQTLERAIEEKNLFMASCDAKGKDMNLMHAELKALKSDKTIWRDRNESYRVKMNHYKSKWEASKEIFAVMAGK